MEYILQKYKETIFDDVLLSYLSFSLFAVCCIFFLLALSLYAGKITKSKKLSVLYNLFIFALLFTLIKQFYLSVKSFYGFVFSEEKKICCPVKSFEYSKRLIFEDFDATCLNGIVVSDERVSFDNMGFEYNYLEYDKRKSPLVCFTKKGNFLKINSIQEVL